jgi:hypothetical protein
MTEAAEAARQAVTATSSTDFCWPQKLILELTALSAAPAMENSKPQLPSARAREPP